MSASQLLSQLLDYVFKQDKEIDPRRFKLSTDKGFIKGKPDLHGLPGIDFDIARGRPYLAAHRAVEGSVSTCISGAVLEQQQHLALALQPKPPEERPGLS